MNTNVNQHTQSKISGRTWWFTGIGIAMLALALFVTSTVVSTHAAGPDAKKVKPMLQVVGPTQLGAPGDGANCNYVVKDNKDSLGTEFCHLTLFLPANASNSIKWTAKPASACTVDRIDFIPANSGTIAPGQRQTVWFIIQPCNSAEDIFFTGPNNTAKVTFHAD